MHKDTLIFIGLDTHKESTEVAYVDEDRASSGQHYGKIPTTTPALITLARDFESQQPGATLHFASEAGPRGYWVYRLLTSLGHRCYVAPCVRIPFASKIIYKS